MTEPIQRTEPEDIGDLIGAVVVGGGTSYEPSGEEGVEGIIWDSSIIVEKDGKRYRISIDAAEDLKDELGDTIETIHDAAALITEPYEEDDRDEIPAKPTLQAEGIGEMRMTEFFNSKICLTEDNHCKLCGQFFQWLNVAEATAFELHMLRHQLALNGSEKV